MVWIMVLGAVTLLLAVVAALLWYRVWQRQRQQLARRRDEQQQVRLELSVIARAVLQQDMDPVEGALRLAARLPYCPVPGSLEAIRALADAAAALDIGAAYRALPTAEQRRQDQLRKTLANQYRTALAVELLALAEHK